MRHTEQVMTKLRMRRLFEEMLDADLVQIDIDEDEETQSNQVRPVKRLSLVARYIPA